MAHTLSVECVSLSINPLITYHFFSVFFLNEARTLNSPAAYWRIQPGELGKSQPLAFPVLVGYSPYSLSLPSYSLPYPTLAFHSNLMLYSAENGAKELCQAFSKLVARSSITYYYICSEHVRKFPAVLTSS